MESAPWDSNEFWGSKDMKPYGYGFISFALPWCGLAGIACLALSKLTKFISVVNGREKEDEVQRVSRWFLYRLKITATTSGEFDFVG
jgi:hypothetical protein